jgi:hypothetical protein
MYVLDGKGKANLSKMNKKKAKKGTKKEIKYYLRTPLIFFIHKLK